MTLPSASTPPGGERATVIDFGQTPDSFQHRQRRNSDLECVSLRDGREGDGRRDLCISGKTVPACGPLSVVAGRFWATPGPCSGPALRLRGMRSSARQGRARCPVVAGRLRGRGRGGRCLQRATTTSRRSHPRRGLNHANGVRSPPSWRRTDLVGPPSGPANRPMGLRRRARSDTREYSCSRTSHNSPRNLFGSEREECTRRYRHRPIAVYEPNRAGDLRPRAAHGRAAASRLLGK